MKRLALVALLLTACGGATFTPNLFEERVDSGIDPPNQDAAAVTDGAEGGVTADADADGGKVDASRDAASDASVDTGIDAPVDAHEDTGIDATVDTGVDAPIDTGIDAPVDTGVDTGVDAPVETGIDASDAGICTGFPADAGYNCVVNTINNEPVSEPSQYCASFGVQTTPPECQCKETYNCGCLVEAGVSCFGGHNLLCSDDGGLYITCQ